MNHLRVGVLEAAQDEAKFAVTGQNVLAEDRLDAVEGQLDELPRRLEAFEKAGLATPRNDLPHLASRSATTASNRWTCPSPTPRASWA